MDDRCPAYLRPRRRAAAYPAARPLVALRLAMGMAMAMVLAIAAAVHAAEQTRGPRPMTPTPEPLVPAVYLEAEPSYVLEFPILVALTLRNETADTDYLNLPDLGLLAPLDSVAVVFKPLDDGPTTRLGPTFETAETNIFRTELMAGESTRALIDLSQFGATPAPGHYEIQVAIYSRAGVYRRCAPIKVDLVAPSSAERAEAQRLRRLGLRPNAVDAGSWQPFLTANWTTVKISPALGELATRQLALHLALHRAAYGPVPLARLPVQNFASLQGPVLAPEAAALEYELLAYQGPGPRLDALRASILGRWPALGHRLQRIDAGAGPLKTLRQGYGAERGGPLPPGAPPYS